MVSIVHFLSSQITMVQNKGKPRGYAFVEYEKERDMHGESKLS